MNSFLCLSIRLTLTGWAIFKHYLTGPHLLHMLNHGWYNVAEGTPDHHNHTYGGLVDWDRTTKCAHTSRIDYILANKANISKQGSQTATIPKIIALTNKNTYKIN